MQSETDFFKNPKNFSALKDKLDVLDKSNINTQVASAKETLKNNLYLQHCAQTAYTVMDQQQEEIEALEEKNEEITRVNTEYRGRFGELDKETLERLKPNQLALVSNSQNRKNKIYDKLAKASRKIQEEENRQQGQSTQRK